MMDEGSVFQDPTLKRMIAATAAGLLMGLVLWIILQVFYGLPVLFWISTGIVWIFLVILWWWSSRLP